MESSEDDAGTATNASRRASAREKDVGLAEDVNATSSFHQEPSEARPTCETPAMSEDNFDGDSVPSPSTQDVNTSTEAILDMIDEIVDGPGAPKRLPLSADDVNMQFDELEIISAHSNNTQESTKSDSDNISPLPVVASPAESVKSEPVLPVGIDSQAESSITSDISAGNVNTDSVDSAPESSSQAEGGEPEVSIQPEDSALSSVVPESPAICPLPIPSSSEEQTVQNISVVSECESQERTVKCVTSSDSRDNVTVESAESTSSDSSVSEGKAVLVEPQVRSPLRRRLVRPAPSDRRPDSTVSSTVDSQIVNIPVVEETGSESITKDVTSSSDAVPTIHGNVKPEEIRNVSEINFCKAETSVSPPKKIKLIRQKVNTGTSNRNTSVDKIAISSEKDQCQSTSSESHSLPLPETMTESSSTDSISKSQENNESTISVSNCVTEMPVKSPEQAVCSDQHSQPSIEQCHLPKIDNSEKQLNNEQELPVQSSSCQPASLIPEANASSGIIAQKNSNLLAPSTAEPIDTKLNVLEQDSASNTVDDKQEVTKDPESNKTVQIPSEVTVTEPSICPESSQISLPDSCKQDNSSLPESADQNNVLQIESDLSTTNVPESKVVESSSIATAIELDPMTNLPESQKEAEQDSVVLPIEPNLSLKSLPESNEAEQDHADIPCRQNLDVSNLPESNLQAEQSKMEENLSSTNLPKTMADPIESSLSSTTLPQSKGEETEQSTVALLPEQNLSVSNLLESKTDTDESTINLQHESESSDTTEQSNVVLPSKQTLVESNLPESTEMLEQSSVVSPCTETHDLSNLTESTEVAEQSAVVAPCELIQVASSLPKSPEIVEQSNAVSPCKQIQIVTNLPESTEAVEQSNVVSLCEQTQVASNLLKSSEIEEQSAVITPCELNLATSNLPDKMPEVEAEQSGIVPPIKLNLSISNLPESKVEAEQSSISKNVNNDESEATKQVPKLTIKLKQMDEMKSPVPKLTIKPIKPPTDHETDDKIPSVTKINIKPILKPPENERPLRSQGLDGNVKSNASEQLPCITKLNIKPIPKPPEKINDIHRKSSSSEISESEYSENDESTSTSDQASASDQGSSDIVPKVTIKLGKPGTDCEGKFYTEKNAPKLTIKAIQPDERDEPESKLKLIISQSEDTLPEKIPKLTIKTVSKSESQPLSPKLTIKPIKPPETSSKENEVSKTKTPTESFSTDPREGHHVPKITIKPVTRSSTMCDSPEHIPVVTKLNIKPILKPTEIGESSEGFDDKVPVVSKLNIKPVIKPKDNDVDSSLDDVPKITKLNIKPIKNPEENTSEEKDCDELNADIDKNCIPVVTKINIKPIIKPQEEETLKDSENQSSETGNSSDDNGDHIPVVTKINIKPIIKPDDLEESSKSVSSSELSIPVVTKLNIKPLIKPGESISPSSPKKEHSKTDSHSPNIPIVTKLNIKPVVRPDDTDLSTSKNEVEEKLVKNPPLVMKINMKAVTENYNNENLHNEHVCNNVSEGLLSIAPKIMKAANELQTKCESTPDDRNLKRSEVSTNDSSNPVIEHSSASEKPKQNCVPEPNQKREGSVERSSVIKKPNLNTLVKDKPLSISIAECDSMMPGSLSNDTKIERQVNESHTSLEHKNIAESTMMQIVGRQKYSSVQNCTLLKKLLENKSDSLDKSFEVSSITNCGLPLDRNDAISKSIGNKDTLQESENTSKDKLSSGNIDKVERRSPSVAKVNDSNKFEHTKSHTIQQIADKTIENMTKPLEITISDKISNQSSGQDSPRIILKINKTDHGPSAKIITEEVKRPETQQNYTENTQDIVNDKQSPRKHLANSRRKQVTDTSLNLSTGKRLRSSRIVENTEKSPPGKRNIAKRSTTDTSPPQNKEPELSLLQTKRLKLGQLLSNKSLTITPVTKTSPPSPTKTTLEMKQGVKSVNHTLLNNENCSKNGNSKLHNILSNLQAKQMQFNNTNCSEKAQTVASDIDLNASMSSSDTGENTHVENSRPEVQEMIIAENTDFREFGATPEEVSQDPLEVDSLKSTEEPPEIVDIPKPVELTPQPKKRGRPRKLPVSEGAKPAAVTLPVPALEERPQRSLRLMRDRPTILSKPRGRGRGRGGRRSEATPSAELETVVVIEPAEPEERPVSGEIDPTSSRIKLPRMTEALDKMPSTCNTPLSSRRRNSSGNFSTGDTPEKAVLDNSKLDEFGKSPEPPGSGRGRGSRGGRGGRGRTPRGRGRGRGGGRGAMYMKETMGIYGRVCGPATTTVQLFEEETCMMDDNATPAKPSHLLDEDSQSSVKSSTNESSNKLKKSKFADLFDSNKVWTAADVKEYTWPPPDKADVEHKVMMIQEQVAMFLGVKSFKRRYPELNRRAISGDERDYVLSKGLVTEALCDLGITAVDASDVLDIMLSDYPHKYEEFRSHQRQRQLTEAEEEPVEETKVEEKVVKVEMKPEKPAETKPEPPKVDPEKARQDMAAAAIASASEWNARANAARRGACADLQSLTVQRARAPPPPPRRAHLRPPAGFYPHALLPGQYQHSYRVYTPDQLRYFPLNTVLTGPPAPASEDWSSESEPDWGSRCSSSDDSDAPTHQNAKRKKLTKTKRSSQAEASVRVKEEPVVEEVDLCRVCKLRLEANRRYTHERFLVCANCNAKLHPSCLELSADTIRKCREYPWQCAECKTCCSCRQPADDDKMLFCDLCDRGFHIYCVGLDTVPSGRWHCVECAVCKSCGARSPGGPPGAPAAAPAAAPADWHHQTRRGPGGHKVYSHSLCTPCARAYRIGRYCPLCERSFIGPKGTMQLVICKLCDRQLHQECVRQSGRSLSVLDYTCAECRRGGITSRAAAVRLAPRTIATLFMAKRRFNKYAHRQYMEQRLREAEPPLLLLAPQPSDDERDDPDAASDPLDADGPPEHTSSCS